MKLWTVQDKKFLGVKGEFLSCGYFSSEPSWQLSYQFMKEYYEKEKTIKLKHPLIWAWHDDSYFSQTDEQLDRVSTVESRAEFLPSKCIINLEVPDEFPILSAYSKWNRLMEYCMTFEKLPKCFEDWSQIFNVDDLAEHEYTQAVIPEIKRSWIVDVVDIELTYFK